MEIYHYRSIERALQEIENCTFYFATSEEVNDPIEGYVRIFWQGDKYAWEGLLRNYVRHLAKNILTSLSLTHDINTLYAFHNSMAIDMTKTSIVPSDEVLKDIGDSFLADDRIQALTTFYGQRKLKIYEKGLKSILYFVGNIALKFCISKYSEMGIISKEDADNNLRILRDELPIKKLFTLMNENPPDSDQLNLASQIGIDCLEDITELRYIQDSIAFKLKQIKGWMTIPVDFPKLYAAQLKRMMYPSNFVVCFSLNDNNSAMWGNYADCHRGVCLIYETDKNGTIEVKGDYNIPYPTKGKSISYGGDLVERNFFETLGGINSSKDEWLIGADGSCSSSLEAFKDKEHWENEYRKICEIKAYSKLKEWASEQEYRIVLDSIYNDFSTQESRTLKYDPKCLRGVIFGIRTSEYDKRQIVEKLLKHKAEYDNFNFYQAEFDDEKQIIAIRPKTDWESLMA